MNNLTKDQKDEYATSLAAIALYDGEVSLWNEQNDRISIVSACRDIV